MTNRTRHRLRRLIEQAAEIASAEGLDCEGTLREILATVPEPERVDPRHAARKLGSFTVTEIQQVLGVSRPHASREVRKMAERGTIRDTGLRRKHNGPGRPAPVYEYVQAPATITSRPRQTPVELEAIKGVRTRSPGAPTKKRRRLTDPGIRELVAACRKAGCRVNDSAGSGHIIVYTPDGGIVTLPFTPSGGRTIHNYRSRLRRAGIKV